MMEKNYTPESMSFSMGFLGMPYGARGNKGMLVDEAKAKRIIERELKRGRNVTSAELGLDGDFRENSTEIYDGENFHPYDAYGGSLWATPILMLYFKDEPNERHECYKFEGEEAEFEIVEPLQLSEGEQQ